MKDDQLFFPKKALSSQIKKYLVSNLNAPNHLDSEAVLNAIEVQQGILVERAEDTYSFSHLTLQEYLTAQYLIDNEAWRDFVRKHLTNNRWREIFLLLTGLMPGKLGSDSLLLMLEKQADLCFNSPKLQQFTKWVVPSIQKADEGPKSSAKRVSATVFTLLLSLDYERARALGLNFADGRDITVSRSLEYALDLATLLINAFGLNFDRIRTLSRALDLNIDINMDLACDLENTGMFTDVDFGKLVGRFERLKNDRPKADAHRIEKENFIRTIYGLWFSALGLDSKIVTLSESDLESLAEYFYICELMIRCKEGATRVSPKVWEGIEVRMLTVPAKSETPED